MTPPAAGVASPDLAFEIAGAVCLSGSSVQTGLPRRVEACGSEQGIVSHAEHLSWQWWRTA